MMEYRIILMDMPATIKGYTLAKDGFYTIVLNSILNFEQNQKTLQHELNHIKNGDFEKKCSAHLLEVYAHETTEERKLL